MRLSGSPGMPFACKSMLVSPGDAITRSSTSSSKRSCALTLAARTNTATNVKVQTRTADGIGTGRRRFPPEAYLEADDQTDARGARHRGMYVNVIDAVNRLAGEPRREVVVDVADLRVQQIEHL